MTDDEKLKLKQMFTWQLMRLGVIASDARTSYDVISNSRNYEKWLMAKARLEEAEELEKMIFALLADKAD